MERHIAGLDSVADASPKRARGAHKLPLPDNVQLSFQLRPASLETDPYETRNVYAENPAIVERSRELLKRVQAENTDNASAGTH